MCTLACWIGTHPLGPLVVAANRDEVLGRPSRAPFVWDAPRVIAPLDERAGGTWWAINAQGMFVALTNRAGANVDAGRRSRGQLVLDVATCRDLDAAQALLRGVRADDYNGFHLIATDGRGGVLAIDNGERMRVEPLGKGLHVISERSFGASPVSRDGVVEAQMTGTPSMDEMQKQLALHLEDRFQSICVHLPGIDYGTRSSTVIAMGGKSPTLRFADGSPCVTPWQDLSGMMF